MYSQRKSREEARAELILRFLRTHGPVTKYEVMERYGFSDRMVQDQLERIHGQGSTSKGEYAPTKSFPQW